MAWSRIVLGFDEAGTAGASASAVIASAIASRAATRSASRAATRSERLRLFEDVLTGRTHRILTGVSSGHPPLPAESRDGIAGDVGLGDGRRWHHDVG